MGQGIQDFYNTAKSFGFSRDYQLRVAQIGDLFAAPSDGLFVYAKAAALPKRSIQTIPVSFKGFKYNVPMQSVYDSESWTLKIYCDESFVIRTEFEKWQKHVFDEHTMQGNLENKIVQLNVLNDRTDTVMIYRLHGVVPQSIGEIQYDLGGSGVPQSFDITFAYQYWTSEIVSKRFKEDQGILDRISGAFRGIAPVVQGVNNVVKGVKNVTSFLGGG